MTVIMSLMIIDMLFRIFKTKRNKTVSIAELLLYFVYACCLIGRLCKSNVFASLTARELAVAGGEKLLPIFFVICIIIIISLIVVSIDAKKTFSESNE